MRDATKKTISVNRPHAGLRCESSGRVADDLAISDILTGEWCIHSCTMLTVGKGRERRAKQARLHARWKPLRTLLRLKKAPTCRNKPCEQGLTWHKRVVEVLSASMGRRPTGRAGMRRRKPPRQHQRSGAPQTTAKTSARTGARPRVRTACLAPKPEPPQDTLMLAVGTSPRQKRNVRKRIMRK